MKRRRIVKERAFVPLLGLGCATTLNAARWKPKNPPFCFYKPNKQRLLLPWPKFTPCWF